MSQLFCDESENLVPIDMGFMAVYEGWQKLSKTQKEAIIIHINSYIGGK